MTPVDPKQILPVSYTVCKNPSQGNNTKNVENRLLWSTVETPASIHTPFARTPWHMILSSRCDPYEIDPTAMKYAGKSNCMPKQRVMSEEYSTALYHVKSQHDKILTWRR